MRCKSGTQVAGGKAHQRHPTDNTQKVFGKGKQFALRGIDCRPVRREGIADRLYCNWSKEFLKSVEKRPTGDTVPAAITDEVKHLRHKAR